MATTPGVCAPLAHEICTQLGQGASALAQANLGEWTGYAASQAGQELARQQLAAYRAVAAGERVRSCALVLDQALAAVLTGSIGSGLPAQLLGVTRGGFGGW